MIHKEYSWQSSDGLKLFGQSWIPDGMPKTVIEYVHGFRDHSSRFEKWALQFVAEGYGVISIDLRGHGRSEGKRGYASSYRNLIKDVMILRQNSENLFPGVPHVLYGHSLGGNIVVNYLISENTLPQAAIITSPWFTLAYKPPKMKLLAAAVLRYFFPGLRVRSDMDSRGLSRDDRVIRDYDHDPLVHNFISLRLFFEIEEYGLKASRSIYKINIPLLVMHGSADRITSYKHTEDFVRNSSDRTTFKAWAGHFHELHRDTGADEVFHYLIDWLNQQNLA